MASEITELAHLQIPLQKILDATNNFSDQNIIGKGDFGKVYRGKLEHDGKMIKIAARRLDRKYGHGDVEFWKEVSTLFSFRHEDHIVNMIGFCDDKDEKIVINHYYPKGSLLRYISDPLTLDVNQRLNIAFSLPVGLAGIHEMRGTDYYIIHRNINTSTILLDKKWKLFFSGFEFSIQHLKEEKNHLLLSEVIGTQGYIDPAIQKYGGVNYKSDIYSVGVVLFELLCGRKAFEENTLLAPLAKFHYEKGTLKDIVHPDIWNQMNPRAFGCYSKAAYSCLHEDPALRPDANKLWQKLLKAKYLQKPEEEWQQENNQFHDYLMDKSASDLDLWKEYDEMVLQEHNRLYENVLDRSLPDRSLPDRSLPKLWKVKKWEHLRIRLAHIPSPPLIVHFKNISPYVDNHDLITFKKEIEYYDRESVSFVEKKNTYEVPKRRRTVMTKMARYRENVIVEYNEDVFLREIEILGSCRHPNIQSFLGYYDNGLRRILFYEYVSDNYLYESLNDVNLTWGKRLKICIAVAHGLDYLHNGMEDQKMVIHGDLNSVNIVLDDILGAKIVGFENSVIFHSNQRDDSIQLNWTIQDLPYMDPKCVKTAKLKRESDVFSFGVVMFEILCGIPCLNVMAAYGKENEGMGSMARRLFDEGTIKKMLATGIKEENYRNNLFLKKGANKDSLDTFINIAYKCLEESQNQRPEIKVVITELHRALSFHENDKDPLRMSFNDIKLATQDFDRANCIGGGGFGLVYKGKLAHGKVNGHSTIVVKKLDTSQGQEEKQYYTELQILYEYNHENVISLIGFSNETDEKLIVYEHASKGSLDKHLNNANLTWRDRLKVCIDVATGLNFLHEGIQGQRVVIHRDIKTANILLFDDWKAKVGDFGLSLISTINKETNFTIDHPCGTKDYVDPMYLKSGLLTLESDVYSLGVTLFEILCGRPIYTIPKHKNHSLLRFITHKIFCGKQDEVVFKAIKEEIVPKSLTTFLDIVCKCLDNDREKRPIMKEVLAQLEKALMFQDENKI